MSMVFHKKGQIILVMTFPFFFIPKSQTIFLELGWLFHAQRAISMSSKKANILRMAGKNDKNTLGFSELF